MVGRNIWILGVDLGLGLGIGARWSFGIGMGSSYDSHHVLFLLFTSKCARSTLNRLCGGF